MEKFGSAKSQFVSPGSSELTIFNFQYITVTQCYDILLDLNNRKPAGPSVVPALTKIDGQSKVVLISTLVFKALHR